MHEFTENQLFDFEIAYKSNPDVLQLIEEIRELRAAAYEHVCACPTCQDPLDE